MCFNGVSPCPTANANGFERQRALVTIAFFALDSQERKNLLQERARCLIALYPQLRIQNDPQADPDELLDAQRVIDAYTSETAPHTNCSRSYRRLFQQDRTLAKQYYQAAVALIDTSS